MVISRVIIRVTPFRALITLLITYLLSPLPLQAVTRQTTSCSLEASALGDDRVMHGNPAALVGIVFRELHALSSLPSTALHVLVILRCHSLWT